MHNLSRRAAALLLAALLLLSLTACGSSAGKTHLTFQIWDVDQRDGMQAMCDAYTANVNPDVDIEVQVTSWSEYWTKLEAAAESNTLPDLFWMHTDQILYYSDFGMLADVTNLYDEEDPDFYQKHFSEISISNAKGSDGRMYGVPKDKDNVCLVYSRELFDQAGVPYPDETWTWDTLVDASAKIYEATGAYGFMAYNDEQLGYHNFIYQNGGCVLTEDKTQGGFDQPATQDAVRFYVNLQSYDWCPNQAYFAETSPGTAFISALGSMYLDGSWNLLSTMKNYPDMMGKWDVAVLPIAPNPASGSGRASISNGLTYATGAHGRNLDVVLDVLRYFGTEEAQRIQGESGAAIPAYLGLEETWISAFNQFDYQLNLQAIIDQFDYAVQYANNAARPKWKSGVVDIMTSIYNGSVDIDTGLANIQTLINTETAKKLADSQ